MPFCKENNPCTLSILKSGQNFVVDLKTISGDFLNCPHIATITYDTGAYTIYKYTNVERDSGIPLGEGRRCKHI